MSRAKKFSALPAPSNAHTQSSFVLKTGPIQDVGLGNHGPTTGTNTIALSTDASTAGAKDPITMYISTSNSISWDDFDNSGSITAFSSKPACFFMQVGQIAGNDVSIIRDWANNCSASSYTITTTYVENQDRVMDMDFVAFEDNTTY